MRKIVKDIPLKYIIGRDRRQPLTDEQTARVKAVQEILPDEVTGSHSRKPWTPSHATRIRTTNSQFGKKWLTGTKPSSRSARPSRT